MLADRCPSFHLVSFPSCLLSHISQPEGIHFHQRPVFTTVFSPADVHICHISYRSIMPLLFQHIPFIHPPALPIFTIFHGVIAYSFLSLFIFIIGPSHRRHQVISFQFFPSFICPNLSPPAHRQSGSFLQHGFSFHPHTHQNVHFLPYAHRAVLCPSFPMSTMHHRPTPARPLRDTSSDAIAPATCHHACPPYFLHFPSLLPRAVRRELSSSGYPVPHTQSSERHQTRLRPRLQAKVYILSPH